MKSLHSRRHAMTLVILCGIALSASGATIAAADPADTPGASGQLLSAFFGLDNGLPFGANRLCLGASGKDGMPLVLSQTINLETLQPEDFKVVTRAGAEHTPLCVTARPANDRGELRTVLLIGEFGDARGDPPISVTVVGDLLADGAHVQPLNFRGATVTVTPLEAGPSLVWAEVVPATVWQSPARGSSCPDGTRQVVRVTWAGGVRLPNGDEPGEAERILYRVTVSQPDGSIAQLAPSALADLGDNDNNHLLCLDTLMPATVVEFPAGHFVDPNGDLNTATRIPVSDSEDL